MKKAMNQRESDYLIEIQNGTHESQHVSRTSTAVPSSLHFRLMPGGSGRDGKPERVMCGRSSPTRDPFLRTAPVTQVASPHLCYSAQVGVRVTVRAKVLRPQPPHCTPKGTLPPPETSSCPYCRSVLGHFLHTHEPRHLRPTALCSNPHPIRGSTTHTHEKSCVQNLHSQRHFSR